MSDPDRPAALLTGSGEAVSDDHAIRVEDLRRAVETFDPLTEREMESRQRMLVELDRLGRPFDRDADPVHVTGSAIIVGARGTVLHRHKRLGIWLQTGGHVGPGETPAEAARREAVEETGLPVRHPDSGPSLLHLDVLDVHDAYVGHTHMDLRYLLIAPDLEPTPPAGESQEVRWFSLAEAEAVADAGLIDALRRVRPGELEPGTGTGMGYANYER